MSHNSNPEELLSLKSLVQEHFGKQAEDYNSNYLLADQGNLNDIIRLAGITSRDRVLDVAAGTGFLAAALSHIAGRVVVTDLTLRMLEQARARIEKRDNVTFALADAESLPVVDCSFDVVSCRVAFHHFPHPLAGLSEMVRVCNPGGRVVFMDIISAEDELKSEYHNLMEKLRDPSHVREYQLSELRAMFQRNGLEITDTKLWSYTWQYDEWMRIGGPDKATAEKVRALMLDSIDGDKSGLQVELRQGELFFTYTAAIIIARKAAFPPG